MGNNNKYIAVGAVIVVVVIVAAIALSNNGGGVSVTTTIPQSNVGGVSSPSTMAMPVMITDPAQVPAGTSALVFAYSNVQLNSTNSAGSAWINATGSGSVNLIAIQNSSQVMGYANISANSSVSQVRLLVNSVYITINGTTYPVPVSNPQLTLSIIGNTGVNATSGVLIDYTPTVSPSFEQNTTTFIRVPAGKAVITGGVNSTFATSVGAVARLSAVSMASIARASQSISITSASLESSGNSTSISVTVQNNANQTVVLNNLIVYGAQNVSAGPSAAVRANGTIGIGGPIGAGIGASANASAVAAVRLNLHTYAMQNFAIGQNGSMALITNSSSAQARSGVAIGAGSSVTINYNSTATYNSRTVKTVPTAGSEYRIVVSGRAGISASTKVIAG